MTKWRPSLWFVVMGGLGGTLAVSFLGLVALRYLGPEIGFRSAAAILGLAIALATAFLGWLMVRLLLRPVDALTHHARAVRQGEAAAPLRHFGTQELRDLAASVTQMGAVLRRREAAIRTFSDHVTHEVKTPVTTIRAAAELMEDSGVAEPALLAQITGATEQIERQLGALRAMSAAREPGHMGWTRLADVVPSLPATPLTITTTGADLPLPLAGDGLRIVLGHLIGNAGEAGASAVTIVADTTGITLSDDGPGISEGNADRLFEPFFTTRRDTGGTGMGLPIVRALLEAHGWTIDRAPSDAGTTWRLRVPAA